MSSVGRRPHGEAGPLLLLAAALAAPCAWAAQLTLGSQVEEVGCSPAPDSSAFLGISNELLILAISALAALVALAGGFAALRVLRLGRRAAGGSGHRNVFIGALGLAAAAVFVVLIAMGAVQLAVFGSCETA